MAIQLLSDELKFEDVQDLWAKARNLGAKMVSKYFNFEIDPEEISIEGILVDQEALITATYTKIPLKFRITLNEKKIGLEILTERLKFEEAIE
uniref:Uncharacterized protein n=1 Tax=Sulfolobus tengchongensis TaxID=207809 RepID=Q6H0Z4_9CREN|nr:hypothetical protein [Sulfolobus tengchongensis]AAT46502.1 hypothetical protein [Sulfolobus tengchongensis]